jgi:hypothetical protein
VIADEILKQAKEQEQEAEFAGLKFQRDGIFKPVAAPEPALPWSDANSDPMGDLQQAINAMQGAPAVRQIDANSILRNFIAGGRTHTRSPNEKVFAAIIAAALEAWQKNAIFVPDVMVARADEYEIVATQDSVRQGTVITVKHNGKTIAHKQESDTPMLDDLEDKARKRQVMARRRSGTKRPDEE